MPHTPRENVAEISWHGSKLMGKVPQECVENREKNWRKIRETQVLFTL
jgi:hypothetical protein